MFRNDDISNTKVNTKGCPGVFDPCHYRCADTGILFGDRNGCGVFDFKGDKIISGGNSNDLFQNGSDLLRGVGDLTQQEVHIDGNPTVKLRNRIYEQAAL